MSDDRIDNELLREAVQRSDLSLAEIARRCGMVKTSADTSKLTRMLGMKPWSCGNGRTTTIRTVDYDKAVTIARAIDADPVDVGL